MPNLMTYPLNLFAGDFRWEGLLDIPAHRRLSDFLNDRDLQFLELRDVQHALWDGTQYSKVQTTAASVLLKTNIVMVVLETLPSAPKSDSMFERVEKVPRPLELYAPPLRIQGAFHIPPLLDWFAALKAARTEFLPLTNVTLWDSRTGALLYENLPLGLVRMQHITALGALGAAPDAP